MEVMTLTMNTTHVPTINQMADFVSSSSQQNFSCQNTKEAYAYIALILTHHKYRRLRKPDKGIVRLYLMAVTGYSRAQFLLVVDYYQRYNVSSLQS
jgi:hypothetical protein